MAKKKKRKKSQAPPVPTTASLKEAARQAKSDAKPRSSGNQSTRETIEGLVVAVVLALLFRTFIAEMFVIPTGSMAPTLMGRHKDVNCDQCGERFRVNASDEEGAVVQQALSGRDRRGRPINAITARGLIQSQACVGGACPVCRYVTPFESAALPNTLPEASGPEKSEHSYSGDRVLVNKLLYQFAEPERWDVIVFKFPGNATTNYIKRLVGLPGETVRIRHGDLHMLPPDAAEAEGAEDDGFEIASKPPKTVLAMRQLVHDTDHDPASLYRAGWPLRWSATAEGDGWSVEAEEDGIAVSQAYRGEASATTAWLRYRHTPPNDEVWRPIRRGEPLAETEPAPSLVTDFTAYNAKVLRSDLNRGGDLSLQPFYDRDIGKVGVHWVGDLSIDAELAIESPTGQLAIDLVEAGAHCTATIDIATGKATLSLRPPGADAPYEGFAPSADTPIRGAGSHSLTFANVDDRLTLWVDGEVVLSESYTDVEGLGELLADTPQTGDNDLGDLAPAGVGLTDAKATITRMAVWRDTYYLADSSERGDRVIVTDFDKSVIGREYGGQWLKSIASAPSQPELWDVYDSRRTVEFPLQEDQFFVMGDNSPESLDARLWSEGSGRDLGKPGGAYLERPQLIGKAVCVYWPHSWYSVPMTGRRIPAWPNFGDMRMIR
ncbi:signal peptidase I [Pseudobythopirellula maris]|uniref:Signal peptidase I n=1 Tax=Pseudobythopirellula maris TaxID=2527991 RepID=A0A5C5ZM31_9BACT|nr:signal peptidase I [Pseudobythopirellula maris]TWT88514.1 signal peptidase I [Pseudobythopirellula maris]